MVQAAKVGEPTRRGWEAALKAVIYFLRPEEVPPRGSGTRKDGNLNAKNFPHTFEREVLDKG